MAGFGTFPGRESRVYALTIEAHSVPVSLLFPVSKGGSRDFVFVPDVNMAKEFSRAFEGFSYSKALGSIYRYVGRGRMEVVLSDEQSYPFDRIREARFALVKWEKSANLEFPNEVHCIQQLRYGPSGHVMNEVVTANLVSGQTAGGAL